MSNHIETITPSELELILAYRSLGARDTLTLTKLDGKLDCKITTTNTTFVASDKGVVYNIPIK